MMNLLDAILLAVAVLALARGLRRGAFVQLGSMLGAIGGLLTGFVLGPAVAAEVVGAPGPALAVTTLAVLILALLIGQALGVALGTQLRREVGDGAGRRVDQTAGALVGVLTVTVAIWLLAGTFAHGPSALLAQQIGQSRVTAEVARVFPAPPDVVGRMSGFLDQQGFPQAIAGLGVGVAGPVDPPLEGEVAAAVEAAADAAVRIRARGCEASTFGSGFVTQPEVVVTNAHVLAGADRVLVDDRGGAYEATVIGFDPARDLAVLRVPGLSAPTLPWASLPVRRGDGGAILGYPGGVATLTPKAAAVRGQQLAVGRDIYGRGQVGRDVLTLSADVTQGDSGAAFVTPDGQVAGVVFAAAAAEPEVGYALSVDEAAGVVATAIGADMPVATGACRF